MGASKEVEQETQGVANGVGNPRIDPTKHKQIDAVL
jgi:hypothetical protein